MFQLSLNLSQLKQAFFLRPLLFKNGFSPSVVDLREFYKILLTPSFDFSPIDTRSGTSDVSLVRLIHKGKTVQEASWGNDFTHTGGGFLRDPRAILEAINLKASVVFNQYHRYSQKSGKLASFFQSVLGGVVGCNAYLSQYGGKAFPVHADSHHVLIFAISGQKRWRVYNKKQSMLYAHNDLESIDSEEEVILSGCAYDEIMDPGDVLYIPIGQYHDVENLSDNSLHITISLTFKPATELILDIIKSTYLLENLNLKEESMEILNRPHPVYYHGKLLSKDLLLKELKDLFFAMEDLISNNDNFVSTQLFHSEENPTNCFSFPSEELLDSLTLCKD